MLLSFLLWITTAKLSRLRWSAQMPKILEETKCSLMGFWFFIALLSDKSRLMDKNEFISVNPSPSASFVWMKAWLRIPWGSGPELQNEEEVENLDHGMITIFPVKVLLCSQPRLCITYPVSWHNCKPKIKSAVQCFLRLLKQKGRPFSLLWISYLKKIFFYFKKRINY